MSNGKKTKIDIIESVYEKTLSQQEQNTSITKEMVKSIVEGTLDEMKNSLLDGYEIEIRGFGVFKFQYRQPRHNAHNPRTKEKMSVPEHSVVNFQAGKALKAGVWSTGYGKKKQLNI